MVIPCRAEKRWPGGGSRRLAGERIQDDGAQEAERVRKRNLHNAEGTFTGILFCIRVLRVDCTGGRRIIQWDVPEQWLGGELEAEGDVFEKWGGFRESEVVHSPFSQEDSWVNQRE